MKKKLHHGVIIKLTSLRSKYWIPWLKQQTKSIVYTSCGCNHICCTIRHDKIRPCTVRKNKMIYAPPNNVHRLYCQKKKKPRKEWRAYIFKITNCVNRVMHMDLVENLATKEFINCFKILVAQRQRISLISSDNAKTFQAAPKWLNSKIWRVTQVLNKWKLNM